MVKRFLHIFSDSTPPGNPGQSHFRIHISEVV